MGKLGGTFGHDPFDLLCLCTIGQIIKVHGFVDGIEEAIGVKGFKQKAVAGIVFNIQIFDSIMDSAGIMGHRKGAVKRGYHLRKAAGLETRGHQDKIPSRVRKMLQPVIKIADCHAVLKSVIIDNVSEYHLVIAVGDKDDLQILVPVFRNKLVKNFR